MARMFVISRSKSCVVMKYVDIEFIVHDAFLE